MLGYAQSVRLDASARFACRCPSFRGYRRKLGHRHANLALASRRTLCAYPSMADRSGAARASATNRLLAQSHTRLAAGDAAVLRSQIAIAQIAAPTGDESERGAWIAQRFASLG